MRAFFSGKVAFQSTLRSASDGAEECDHESLSAFRERDFTAFSPYSNIMRSSVRVVTVL